jgi:hypothetical protein
MEQEIEQNFRTAKVGLYARHDSTVNRTKALENKRETFGYRPRPVDLSPAHATATDNARKSKRSEVTRSTKTQAPKINDRKGILDEAKDGSKDDQHLDGDSPGNRLERLVRGRNKDIEDLRVKKDAGQDRTVAEEKLSPSVRQVRSAEAVASIFLVFWDGCPWSCLVC